ncbi:MAG: glycoside hydrolase family 13 protein [Anaerovoracaceae bacterium]|nr:glycoside hydrolase family 13 protein [Anaerovoracaceae bacterium]
MNDRSILFDPSDLKYKEPFGAVRSGTKLRFRIGVDREIVVADVFMVVKYDRHDKPAIYRMEKVKSDSAEGKGDEYEVSFVIGDSGLYWYEFDVHTDLGLLRTGRSEDDGRAVINDAPHLFQQTVYDQQFEEPDWIYGGVFYHIFVDRFASDGRRTELPGKVNRSDWGGMPEYRAVNGRIMNNDFFGGDLEGIRQKLDYLEDLGVTCLYLSPIFEAYSNHKYDTGDYMKIDPMFGTEEDFRRLCEDAGRRGIRIILDGVFAHTGSDSVYFDKYGHYGTHGAWSGKDSPYRDWYYIHDDGTYETWWGIDTLPKLYKDSEGYKRFLMGDNGPLRYWLRAGASGWRLDVADELPSIFMRQLAATVKDEKPDALIIGEVWEDASNKIAYSERKNYFEGDKIDSVMDYPMRTAIINFIRFGDANQIARTVETICMNYPAWAVNALMNSLGTHDTERILTALAGQPAEDAPREILAEMRLSPEEKQRGRALLKQAVLLQMTLPGVPCIYYGDEALMEGYKDPFNRQCFPWGEADRDMLNWYRKLIWIRRQHEVYKSGRYRTLVCEDGCYAFERYENGYGSMITAVNRGEAPKTVIVSGRWRDLISDKKYDNVIVIAPGKAALLEER